MAQLAELSIHPADATEAVRVRLGAALDTAPDVLRVLASDPEVSRVLIKAAREKDTRGCFLLLDAILDTPGLADRLLEALRPESARASRKQSNGRRTL